MKLLEREAFLDTLTGYARDARQGSGRLVLISGESGMGKTVLVEAFQQQLRDARWLWGSCDGLLTPRPLGPLFDIGPQKAWRTGRSPGGCSSPSARCSITCPPCCPRSVSRPAPPPPARPPGSASAPSAGISRYLGGGRRRWTGGVIACMLGIRPAPAGRP